MARRLGMNPKKLPRLRPGPQERWKLPVSEFIEDLYAKRFGVARQTHVPDSRAQRLVSPNHDADVREHPVEMTFQVADLVCYLTNLADDLQRWLAHGTIEPPVLPELSGALREIAAALDMGA